MNHNFIEKRERAIRFLRADGWIINNPDEIQVVDDPSYIDSVVVLKQHGNGEWVVDLSDGSVAFFQED